ncbi:uncharacterized protein IL334_001254 [Kwoniella shivajii]|uniref:Uncharacterized protein n=1 Tax=Kwoniella shivajii TaxID=564305 RepID=A0ABZ1CSJ2_9TREE|nr:hypothetical protein IL334_001254 [Kwoniella shivajii]
MTKVLNIICLISLVAGIGVQALPTEKLGIALPDQEIALSGEFKILCFVGWFYLTVSGAENAVVDQSREEWSPFNQQEIEDEKHYWVVCDNDLGGDQHIGVNTPHQPCRRASTGGGGGGRSGGSSSSSSSGESSSGSSSSSSSGTSGSSSEEEGSSGSSSSGTGGTAAGAGAGTAGKNNNKNKTSDAFPHAFIGIDSRCLTVPTIIMSIVFVGSLTTLI